ncbi:MAG: prolipoprotein diacylglyceryl transferase family protein [Terracidiphilus sp.]
MPYSFEQVHPVLFHIGAIVIPSYGALAAIGVLAGLALALHTARVAGVSPNYLWNLCVISLFAALIGSRVLLFALNWREVVRHPSWMLSLAMIHHPLVTGAAAAVGLAAAWFYARWQRMPMADSADALAAPVAVGLACEQFGALMAGSGYGTETASRWAVTYSSPLAARWSGAPLGVPLHPVQAYAALGFLTLAILLLVILPARRQHGDAAGIALIGFGAIIFLTESWRDWAGRGALLHGALDGPQVAGVLLLMIGALGLRERRGATIAVAAHG